MWLRQRVVKGDMKSIYTLFSVLLCWKGILSNPSVRDVFYLHTTPRTWNEAKVICEAETAEMFRVTDEYTIDKLLYIDNTSDWSGNFSKLMNQNKVWLALYETQDTSHPYLFHGCIKPDTYNWAVSQPNNLTNQEVCVAMDASYTWSTHLCNQSYYFICQRHDGDCWFDPQDNRLGNAQTLTVNDVNVADEAECATLCRNGWINNTECWGFSYRKSDKLCKVHYHKQATIFIKNTPDSIITNTDWTFYAKICVGGLLRSVQVNYENDNTEPHVLNCTDLALVQNEWDESVCYCECRNPPPMWEPTISSLTLEQKIAQIVEALAINAKNTSAAQRKLISVMDARPSAQSIGYVGIVFLTVVFGSLVVLDLNVLVSHTNKLIKAMKDPNSSRA